MSRYLISAIEQALWSLLSLGVNLLLIRLVAPVHYGAFAFWANCGFVLASLQNALTVCHLQVLAPGDVLAEPRLSVERLMHMVTAAFLVVVALGALAGVMLLERAHSPLGAPAAILFLPAFLLQQYIRALAFTRARPATAAAQTGLVLVAASALLAACYAARALSADHVLLCLGLAYGSVGLLGAAQATRGQLGGLDVRALLKFKDYVTRSGWIFLGVSSTELLTRFYAFVVAGWYGPAALASLSATQQLLRPMAILASSWSMVERADLARRREAGDWRGVGRVVTLAALIGAALTAAWTLAIFAAWGPITTRLFAGRYAPDRWMILLWGASAAIGFAQVAASTGLQALMAFKSLALANAAASIVAAGAILLIMRLSGYPGAIAGTATGQMLELIVMAALLSQLLAERRGPGARE
jgi:O-antigen/teichoic acid export membrane protein